MEREERNWHLDKRVNVSIIVALLIQAALFGVGWGVINEKVSQIERRLDGFADRAATTDREVNAQGEEIAVLTSEIQQLTRQLERLYLQGETTNQLLRQVLTGGGQR